MNRKTALAVAVGGGLGTCLRYVLTIISVSDTWLNATLIINIMGCLLLGIVSGWFFIRSEPEWLKVGLSVGLCGGFTTMSAFAAESVRFASYGSHLFLYIMSSLVGGVVAVGIGWFIGTRLGERRRAV
ncbi:fluoride efflux transporter FluC [Alkalicoccobacillus murimartini]|uniref:Fluoride-specific ion channel FluC n=1 Tax=Alkalicoccobacillus murimartini TaxID=171685 RepID=A0ABT9YL20_9BACI|nr:CrcB family protein [Alkalicoccobacillus murimartini]MDQ0208550.1 CrcB protein [Alkalicoccobacillus murimartini]